MNSSAPHPHRRHVRRHQRLSGVQQLPYPA